MNEEKTGEEQPTESAPSGLSGIVRRVTGKEVESYDYSATSDEAAAASTAQGETTAGEAGPGEQPGQGQPGQGERGPRRNRGPRRDSTPPPPPATHVPLPSKRGPLSDDLERELEEALGGKSLEEVIAEPKKAATPADEGRQRGQIVKVHGDNVFFTLGGRNEGVASLRNFKTPPNVGDVLDVVVTSTLR